MLGEWVIVTPKRADRPFQDGSNQCPFCPRSEEISGEWQVLTLNDSCPEDIAKELREAI